MQEAAETGSANNTEVGQTCVIEGMRTPKLINTNAMCKQRARYLEQQRHEGLPHRNTTKPHYVRRYRKWEKAGRAGTYRVDADARVRHRNLDGALAVLPATQHTGRREQYRTLAQARIQLGVLRWERGKRREQAGTSTSTHSLTATTFSLILMNPVAVNLTAKQPGHKPRTSA